MAVGNYKKIYKKIRNVSKSDKELEKDSEDDYESDEEMQDSQTTELLLNEEKQSYQNGEICKQWKARRDCKITYVIIVAVCCCFLLASVAISLGITYKCTSDISKNCSEPPVVSYSTVSRSGIYSFYSCHEGFYPFGESTITCQDGVWPAVTFNCSKYCGSPPNIRNSKLQTSGNMAGAVTSYHCLSGYVPVGETKKVCNTNGQWSSSELSCLKDCGNPPKRGLSNTFYTSTYTGSKAISYCENRHMAIGRPVITCQDDGTWTRDFFYCKYVAERNRGSSDIRNTRNWALIMVICSTLFLMM